MYEDENFEKWYEEILNIYNNDLNSLKETVIREKSTNRYRFTILIIVLLLTTFILILLGKAFNMINVISITILIMLLIIVPTIAILVLINNKESMRRRIDLRKSIPNIIFKSFNNSLEYYTLQGISERLYKEAGIEYFNHYNSGNLMTFLINNTFKLQMAETYSYYSIDDTMKNYFSGTFSVVDTPKNFNSTVYIKKNKKTINDDNTTKVDLDSQDFENKFDVYASDPIIAMQLLTSDTMQILNDFYTYMDFYEYKPDGFEITIKNNKIYIRVWHKTRFDDLFLNDTELHKSLIYKNYRTINFILSISSQLIKLIDETPYI